MSLCLWLGSTVNARLVSRNTWLLVKVLLKCLWHVHELACLNLVISILIDLSSGLIVLPRYRLINDFLFYLIYILLLILILILLIWLAWTGCTSHLCNVCVRFDVIRLRGCIALQILAALIQNLTRLILKLLIACIRIQIMRSRRRHFI